MSRIDTDRIKNAMKEILIAIGVTPDREGLKDTPNRIAKMYSEIFPELEKIQITIWKCVLLRIIIES